MKHPLDQMVTVVESADDRALLKSIRNCHVVHIDSIVVRDRDERLQRYYLAWPGHELQRNTPESHDWCVGVHNHRYALRLQHVSGIVYSHQFEAVEGDEFLQWRCGKLGADYIETGRTGLRHKSSVRLMPGEPLELTSQLLHTVSAEGPASWFVTEGSASSEEPRLIRRSAPAWDERLYQKFESADQIREHARTFREAVHGTELFEGD